MSLIWVFLSHSGQKYGGADLLNATHLVQDDHEGEHAVEDHREAEAAVVISADGVIQEVSEEFCRILEVECGALEGELIFDYINGVDLPEMVAAHSKLLQNGDPVEAMGPYRMIKGKKEMLVLFSAEPQTRAGKVVKIKMTAKDLSDKVDELKGENRIIDELYPRVKDVKEVQAVLDKISFRH